MNENHIHKIMELDDIFEGCIDIGNIGNENYIYEIDDDTHIDQDIFDFMYNGNKEICCPTRVSVASILSSSLSLSPDFNSGRQIFRCLTNNVGVNSVKLEHAKGYKKCKSLCVQTDGIMSKFTSTTSSDLSFISTEVSKSFEQAQFKERQENLRNELKIQIMENKCMQAYLKQELQVCKARVYKNHNTAYIRSKKTNSSSSHEATAKKNSVVVDKIIHPLRPLSPYNYFFRIERERLLKVDGGDIIEEETPPFEYTSAQQEIMLQKQWNQDRTKKRRHRKSHGKISFMKLSKMVSESWKKLSEEHKFFYKEVAAQDWTRYQNEIKNLDTKTN